MNKHQPARYTHVLRKRAALPSTDTDQAIVPGLDLKDLQKLAAISPFYTWLAIRHCIKHKEEFPTWVMDYLRQCADRMISARREDDPTDKAKRARSGKAKRTIDLRDKLPRIFGFPKKKPGPGSQLDLGVARKALQNSMFALTFATEVLEGKSPVQARANACQDVFGKVMEERIMRQHLKEEFGSLPTTEQEWVPVIARYAYDVLRPGITETGFFGYAADRIARAGIPHQPEPSDQRPEVTSALSGQCPERASVQAPAQRRAAIHGETDAPRHDTTQRKATQRIAKKNLTRF